MAAPGPSTARGGAGGDPGLGRPSRQRPPAISRDAGTILTISRHQYPFYPYGTGGVDETGGANLNVPLPAGTGDAGYARRSSGGPAGYPAFGPDLLLIAAGLDAAASDPLGGWRSP